MKGRWTALAVAALASVSAPAQAADWLTLQSTERGREDRGVQVWGFAQILGETILADAVTGLKGANLAPYNGRLASFNVLAGDTTQTSFSVRRLRLGVRGAVPKTSQRVAYFVAAEYGQNALTEASPVKLIDASVSFDVHEALRVRVGQFKLPLADETLESNPNTADMINLSNVVLALLHERTIHEGDVFPGGSGTRDTGVQLSGAPRFGAWELSWAAGLTNGRQGALDDNDAKDVSGRLQLAWLLDERVLHPERDELAFYVWGLTGERDVTAAKRVRRTRAGGGVQWRWQDRWRVRAEGVWASGALIAGQRPPFPGSPPAVVADGDAWGATVLAGFRPIPALELDLGINRLHTLPDGGGDERIAWEQTLGAQYFVRPQAKIMVNGMLRQTDAPQGSADVQTILATQGPRLSVQVTANF
jgi:hypothetical protein